MQNLSIKSHMLMHLAIFTDQTFQAGLSILADLIHIALGQFEEHKLRFIYKEAFWYLGTRSSCRNLRAL